MSDKGIPKDNLYYEIINANNSVLARGTLVPQNQEHVLENASWVGVQTFKSSCTSSGQTYRIVLRSPKADVDNCYSLMALQFTFDPAFGYGGTTDTLVASTNGGSTWSNWADADGIFALARLGRSGNAYGAISLVAILRGREEAKQKMEELDREGRQSYDSRQCV